MLQFSVSGFNGSNKIKTKAFMTPGKKDGKLYEGVEKLTDLDLNMTLTEGDYKEPAMSLWALTQLWVWPLLLLSVVVVKNNFQLDIKISVIGLGMFVFGLLDLFGKRLLEHKYLYKFVAKKKGVQDASVNYGIRFVYLVCILTQLLLLYMIFNVLGWSFWGLEHDHGVWVVGAPEVQQRKMITWAFKFLFLYVYYLPKLLMKLACLIPTKAKKDGQGFTVLGITVSAERSPTLCVRS